MTGKILPSKIIADMSDSSSEDESIASYSDCESMVSSSKRSQSSRKFAVERMPTRRPDPNVSNRNALLARENRRRKKEYVETLEKEIHNQKSINRRLEKQLKKKSKLVSRLESEKQYYRSILANKNQIMDLVATIRNTNMSLSMPKASSCSPTDSTRTSSSSIEPTVFDSENDYRPFDNYDGQWDLLGVDSPFESVADTEPSNWGDMNRNSHVHEVQSNVSNEHNYFITTNNLIDTKNSVDEDEQDDDFDGIDPGVCLHVTRNGISLEFCPHCHQRSKESRNQNPAFQSSYDADEADIVVDV